MDADEDYTKEELKNSKVSVVSHLINKSIFKFMKCQFLIIKTGIENLIFASDENALADKDEVDNLMEEYKNKIFNDSQNELDELI